MLGGGGGGHQRKDVFLVFFCNDLDSVIMYIYFLISDSTLSLAISRSLSCHSSDKH